MTLKQIEAFYWAANLGSFSIAALRLHVTQSSLSKRIFELEESVNIQLFDRSSQRAQLTEAGRRLLPLAGKMLDLKEQLHKEVLAPTSLAGTCRFGVSELVSLTWLPDFTRLVNQDHSSLVFEPYVDVARNLERKVQRGELDFAITTGPSQNPHVHGTVIGRVHFSWVASPSRMGTPKLLRRPDLERHPVITMAEGSGLTRAIDAWAAEQDITLQRIVGCNSLMAIVGLVLADLGISFLPTQFMKPWVEYGTLVALRSDPPLPSLNYFFFNRSDDNRVLLDEMRSYVMRVADFESASKYFAPFVQSRKTNE